MEVKDYFSYIKNEIHSTVFATNDENGFPHTCVIDIMMYDENGLYFITSKGKQLYNRLLNQGYVSVSGMKGNDTLSTIVVSVRGKVKELGNGLVNKIFEENPYMYQIYPKEESRKLLTVFQIYEGQGEYFDLTQCPPFRDVFSFGCKQVTEAGYLITDKCTKCTNCLAVCPSDCIEQGTPFVIRQSNCIHCGSCFNHCSSKAIQKR